MSSLIRSTRLASEVKTLTVPRAPEARKVIGLVPLEGQIAAHDPAGGPVSKPAPVAVLTPMDYPEYEKRFARELATLKEQALALAREEGLRQGLQAGEHEYAECLSTLRSLLAAAQAAQVRSIEKVADDAAEVVLVAVGKVLGEGFLQPEAAISAVREAIRHCQAREGLQVRVAPEQFALIEERRQEWLEGVGAADVTLVADEQVRCGGCVIQSASGTIDARLETQLRRLCETLKTARGNWESSRV
jgi:flagellar assembly protein FliH